MFKSAATKIAHNTTIPALAGANPELRPLQDLITAEKSVLVSLNRLGTDLAKASEALRTWGKGEGDDLGDILTASSALLAHFSGALSTWASLHPTIRDNMKAIRTREEALDDLRRRRKRVCSFAEGAEKKLSKMTSEHKNLSMQTDTLNRLREEIRQLDGEILHEEAALGDYKRKCTKSWMRLKFGGLVECCEKGTIVGNMGKSIVNEIPEDVTPPGFPRRPYGSQGLINDYVRDAEQAISEVKFSGSPSSHRTPTTSAQTHPQDQPRLQHVVSQFHAVPLDLPSPSIGSGIGINVGRYDTQHSRTGSISVDEHGTYHFMDGDSQPAKFFSLPNRREQVSATPPHSSLSLPTFGNGVTEEPSLMASISDALTTSHRTTSIDQAMSIGHTSPDLVTKYEGGTTREGHGDSGGWSSADIISGQKSRTRRSTSPPVLPPGAAPAAIRAWDDGLSQGEDGAHSGRPASSSERPPSQQRISSLETDGEGERELPYDQDDASHKTGAAHDNDDKKSRISGKSFSGNGHEYDANVQMSVNTKELELPTLTTQTPAPSPTQIPGSEPISIYDAGLSQSGTVMHSRSESQRRISRVPPPPYTEGMDCTSLTFGPFRDDVHSTTGINLGMVEPSEKHWQNVATAREITHELDALSTSMVTPVRSHSLSVETPQQLQRECPHSAPPIPSTLSIQPPSQSFSESPSPSPLVPPKAPFTNRSVSPARPSSPAERSPPSNAGSWTQSHMTSGGQLLHMSTLPRLSQVDTLEVGHSTRQRSPLTRTPPEYFRSTAPFTSSLMAKSTSSLNSTGGNGSPRTIPAAAFKRQQYHPRSPGSIVTGDSFGPADTSPLALRRQSPVPQKNTSPKRRLSVVNPDLHNVSDGEDLDKNAAYVAGKRAESYGHHHITMGSAVGYDAGKYATEL